MANRVLPALHLVDFEPSVLEGRTVLVVNSAPPIKFTAATVLLDAGAKVFFACDAAEAVFRLTTSRVTARPFALVIVSLEDDESLHAIRPLREAGYGGPILGINHDEPTHSAQVPGVSGVDDWLDPQFDAEMLEQAAARLMTAEPVDRIPEVPGGVVSDLAVFPQMHAMLECFVEQLPQRIAAMHEAAREHDLAHLQQMILNIKRTANSHGYRDISREAAEAERHLEFAQDLHTTLDDLTDLCQRAIVESPHDTPLPPSA